MTAESNILQQMEDLGEETGLVCVICREGYKFQPGKVLGVYTYTKRCNIEEGETKPRKTVGYSTVTHFNVVHVDCHMNAVRYKLLVSCQLWFAQTRERLLLNPAVIRCVL